MNVGAIPPYRCTYDEGKSMNGLNVKAFLEYAENIRNLQKAIEQDDVQKQMIALTKAIDSLEEARRTMMEGSGILH